ncbi:ATP-binding protein [Streptomyces sp. NPDC006134]|uniref:ATP-binding protein n=1 Tax=Streptomyces sp. NPDC006134 TaxID=3154467 RepID=UPI0033DE5A85
MTTHLAVQERTRRRAPADAALEMICPRGIETALALSIERRPDPGVEGLSRADAAWPKRLRRIVHASLTYWGRPELVGTAKLLVTELVTNAFQHADGVDIGVRMYVRDDYLVIEVNDGTSLAPVPRRPGPDEERGRGLLLIESLAESWGVSADGTTTWCTLPMTKGPSGMEPAAVTAPVLREVLLHLPANPSAVMAARIAGRTRLTMLDWPGNGHTAVDVLGCLVDNAVAYSLTPGKAGQKLSARLGVTEAHELVIDVTDPSPRFPNFTDAIDGTLGRSLWKARELGARVSWFVTPDFEGKTVRAIIKPGEVDR